MENEKILFHIYGTGSQGKTTVIKKLYFKIKEEFPNLSVIEESLSDDIKCVVVIGNCRIGVESQGDPNSRIFKSLKYFVEKKCNIILCCSRTKGYTIEAVNQLKSEYKIERFRKYAERDISKRKYADEKFVNLVWSKMDLYIKEISTRAVV